MKKRRKGYSIDMNNRVRSLAHLTSCLDLQSLNSLLRISGKKEKSLIAEHEKASANKIAELEESLKKKKQVTILAHFVCVTLHFPSQQQLSCQSSLFAG